MKMEFSSKTKLVSFKEFYHGEAYVTFAENITDEYIFEKFLDWIARYSNTFYSFLYFNKEDVKNMETHFKEFLLQEKSSKYFECESKDGDLNLYIHFYKEDSDEFIVKNPNGELTDSITCDFRLKIPSLLDDGNILHQDLSDKLFTMIITNNQSIKILK